MASVVGFLKCNIGDFFHVLTLIFYLGKCQFPMENNNNYKVVFFPLCEVAISTWPVFSSTSLGSRIKQ